MEKPRFFRTEERQGRPIVIGLVGSARQGRNRVVGAFDNLREGISSFSLSDFRESSSESFRDSLQRISHFLQTHGIKRAVIDLEETEPQDIELFKNEVGTHVVKIDRQEAPTRFGRVDGMVTIRNPHRGENDIDWVSKVWQKIKTETAQGGNPAINQT